MCNIVQFRDASLFNYLSRIIATKYAILVTLINDYEKGKVNRKSCAKILLQRKHC
jgi:hypothetical protein